jgi:hypothetical protein
MKPQMPSAPEPLMAFVHAWQVPLQAVSQHTPSTQDPVEHCSGRRHEVPVGKSVLHLLVAKSQYEVVTQWASSAQAVRHALVPQT